MQEIKNVEGAEKSLDLKRVLRILLKRAWLIIAVAVLFGMGGYLYSRLFIAPTYRASFTAYVNNRNVLDAESKTSSSDLSASMGLMYVYQEIIESRAVMTDAVAKCESKDFGDVDQIVTCYVSSTAPVLYVYAETENPQLSYQLACAIAEVAPVHVSNVVDGSSMRIIDAPKVPHSHFAPSNGTNAIYGALTGVVLSVLLAILMDLVADKVQDPQDLEDRYSIPVIGRIPDMLQPDKAHEQYAYGYARAGGKRK